MPTSPSTPLVRPAVEDDLPALRDLVHRTIDAVYRSFLGDESVDAFLGSGGSDAHLEQHFHQGRVHCLDVHGEVAGVLILDGPTVDLVMVDVRRHRQGWGRLLVAHAEETLLARYDTIRLESFEANRGAHAFYEACGWGMTGPVEPTGDGPRKIEFVRSRAAAHQEHRPAAAHRRQDGNRAR